MNLQEALDTADWLLSQANFHDFDAGSINRIRKMRDCLYYLHAAAGIPEIRLDAFDMGRDDHMRQVHEME